MALVDRFKNAWNAFRNKDPTVEMTTNVGSGYFYRPDRVRMRYSADRTIIAAIFNRIALDVSTTTIIHARLDDKGRMTEEIKDGLDECLTLSANKDQTARAFFQDLVLSLFDEGVIAVIPVDSDLPKYAKNVFTTDSFDVLSMRVGRITQWYPDYVDIEAYNDRTGQRETMRWPKRVVAIIENPFYAVMNEPNSTLRRLSYKMGLLDSIDEQSSSGKLDLIIQLPYVIKSEARKIQAEARRKDIEDQLSGSKYGIAYTDGTEKIVQLNRSLDNNLQAQIQDLTTQVYSQLGMTPEILNGTANNEVMTNYLNRTVEVIVAAITDEFKRKFLSRTARTQNQTIYYFRDPFRFITVDKVADIADKLTRNEICSSNEIRQILGMKPADDPAADELRNKNLIPQGTDAANANMSIDDGSHVQNGTNDTAQSQTQSTEVNSGDSNEQVTDGIIDYAAIARNAIEGSR